MIRTHTNSPISTKTPLRITYHVAVCVDTGRLLGPVHQKKKNARQEHIRSTLGLVPTIEPTCPHSLCTGHVYFVTSGCTCAVWLHWREIGMCRFHL